MNKNKNARVAIVKCNSYEQNEVDLCIKKGIELIGGITQFFNQNEKILLKPNILTSEELVSTNKNVFYSIAKYLINNNYQVVYGDSPGFECSDTIVNQGGIAEIAQNLQIPFGDFNTGKIISYKSHKLNVVNAALECDGIISIPKMKTHQLMRITGAVKNQYGCILGLDKLRYHYEYRNVERFSRMLVDLNKLLKVRLYIMDGIIAMDGNGPRSGNPINMNVLLFSSDPVALDTVYCKLINLSPDHVPTIRHGVKSGLGIGKLNRISILGEPIDNLINKKFKVVRRKYFQLKIPFLRKLFNQEFHIDKNACTSCGKCIQACPVPQKAIAFNRNKLPVHNMSICIRCYCCQEMCPSKAMSIKPPLISLKRFTKKG